MKTKIDTLVNCFVDSFMLTLGDTTSDEKEEQQPTAPTQKAGFRVPKTV